MTEQVEEFELSDIDRELLAEEQALLKADFEEQTALMTYQRRLEEQYSKTNTLQFIQENVVCKDSLDEYINGITDGTKELVEFCWAFITQLVLHKACDIKTLFGLLRTKLSSPQEVVDGIKFCVKAGLCNISQKGLLCVKYDLTPEGKVQLGMFQYPMPIVGNHFMAIGKNNQASPYYTLKTGGVILNQKNLSEKADYCLETLNDFISVPYCINMEVANRVDQHWDIESSMRPGEDPSVYKQRIENFNRFSEVTMATFKKLEGLPIHFPFKYDKRGRNYTQGYHANIQGREYQKACIELFHKETITDNAIIVPQFVGEQFTDLDYIKVDIASQFGLDKKTWSERLDWFESHKDNLWDKELLKEADSLPMYTAAVLAYEAYLHGEPTGYCINVDATSSGPQILSAMLGDKYLASLCNVIPMFDGNGKAKRKDLYTEVHNAVVHMMGDDFTTHYNLATSKVDDGEYKITRQHSKYVVMRSFYGSSAIINDVYGKDSPQSQMFEQVMATAAPKAWSLNKALTAAWDKEATSQDWVMPDLFEVHCPVKGTEQASVTYDGTNYFDVEWYVYGKPAEKGRCLCANMVHSLDGYICREMQRRCHYNPRKVRYALDCLHGKATGHGSPYQKEKFKELIGYWRLHGVLSMRIVEFMYPEALLELNVEEHIKIEDLLLNLPPEPFEMQMIHDCFRCSPKWGNWVRFMYTKLLSELNQSNIAKVLLAQIAPGIQLNFQIENFSDEIIQSDYALS